MSAHPDLQPEDSKSMVSYVLSFDKGEDDGEGGAKATDLASIPENKWRKADNGVSNEDMSPGLLVRFSNSNRRSASTILTLTARRPKPLSPVS